MENNTKKSFFKKHKILTALLALVVLGVAITAGGGGSTKTNNSSSSNGSSGSSDSKNETTQVAKIGEAVRDGKFEFLVKIIKCGEASVTDKSGYLTQSAQGQYCLMTLNVKNIGDRQQQFLASDQKLLNADSLEYSYDISATLHLNDGSDIWLNQINPGNSVEGVLAFDIPKDQVPVQAELHDSAFSNGVKVDLQ